MNLLVLKVPKFALTEGRGLYLGKSVRFKSSSEKKIEVGEDMVNRQRKSSIEYDL